jgi:hypothetical protein
MMVQLHSVSHRKQIGGMESYLALEQAA